MHNRLSMDPGARCKLSKLEWVSKYHSKRWLAITGFPSVQALKYMGYNITPQQQKEMHSSLDIDESGRVVFMEFVELAQKMFAFKLEGSHLETNLMLALTHKEELDIPPMPRKVRAFLQRSKGRGVAEGTRESLLT